MEPTFKKILYGGDYNPDQWGKEDIKEDIRQMKHHRVKTVTLPIFSIMYMWRNI